MNNIIIGTAGHIDHGKTTLIRALTGRNTDRWEEERRRGITIDLGFTYFDLPNGDRAGIIDVPGHEKFINNMVAGVVGMDLVLLVISADEGMMPQTREHVDILGLLGIQKSIIVLNKCDLVEEEWLELVEEEVREELEGTFLAQAPILRVSAATGQGLPELVQTIVELTREKSGEKDVSTIPRLPVDRAFSLSGFGTVITGTLISGAISREDTLEMYPVGKSCKIRSIQVHGEDKATCYAGQRVAINLSNVKKKEIYRGCVLSRENSMKNTDLLDVRMQVLPSSMRVLTNHTRLHLFTGTSEILCRAVLLDKEEIGPGESGYVQLRLEEEVAVRRGDRFVVRFYSPMETIGGGVILEPNPTIKRRFQTEVIEELKRKESGSTADVLELHIRKYKETMVTAAELAKVTALSMEEVETDLAELQEAGQILTFPMRKDVYVWHRADYQTQKDRVKELLNAYGEAHPYRYGMKKAELQGACFKQMKPIVFDKVIEQMEADEVLKRKDEFVSRPTFEIRRDALYEKTSRFLLETFERAGYDFLRYSEIQAPGVEPAVQDDILSVLLEEKHAVKVMEDLYTLFSLMEEAKKKILEKLKEDRMITIAQVRDMFRTSRKSAKPILEYMDGIKVTKKTGAESERAAYQ
ncbi:selenocysteine-specific translation elongation factor [Suipraeoptans intestinalis]|uniref:selenocysteine-specific translation elongation factor n=2 Tax=Suipraeoptans intestinalis TaxID=2606628 RepID=UPI002A761BEC|nr:selenocysteine-specific translation elongation factor [Suipraeoptans intestinalis]MDY3121650.1 selenocysteine-specific translation elongation factor [Suipraeoptans intestinalis]